MKPTITITTLGSREFNRDTNRAKEETRLGPVVINDRNRPVHVLLSIEEYRRLAGGRKKIAELLAMPGADDVGLVIPGMRNFAQPADLS